METGDLDFHSLMTFLGDYRLEVKAARARPADRETGAAVNETAPPSRPNEAWRQYHQRAVKRPTEAPAPVAELDLSRPVPVYRPAPLPAAEPVVRKGRLFRR